MASSRQPGSSAQSARVQRPRVVGRLTVGSRAPDASPAGGSVTTGAAALVASAGVAGGGLLQASRLPRIAAAASAAAVLAARVPRVRRTRPGSVAKEIVMGLLVLEALGAGALLVAIVWWTMFAGRKGGERPENDDAR
jgi:hypothetical protein